MDEKMLVQTIHNEIHSELDKLDAKIEAKLDVINIKIDSKVSFKLFTWILGVLMVVVIGIQAIIYSKVEETNGKVGDTKEQVTLIKYRLDNAEITK